MTLLSEVPVGKTVRSGSGLIARVERIGLGSVIVSILQERDITTIDGVTKTIKSRHSVGWAPKAIVEVINES